MELQGMSLQALTEIALNASAIHALGNAALSSGGCVFTDLMDFHTSYLRMDVKNESISLTAAAGGGIETDIDALINRVVLMFVTSFRVAIPAILTSYVDTPIAEAIDNGVMRARNNTNCTPAAPMSHVNKQERQDDETKGTAFGCAWIVMTIGITAIAM
jgi:hypothetical protein